MFTKKGVNISSFTLYTYHAHTNGVFKKNEFSLSRNYMQETILLGNQCQSLELHTTHIHSSNVFEV